MRHSERSGEGATDQYRALFEQSADAILVIDGDRFVDCNQATVDMLRYETKEELLRTHPSELSPPTQPDGRDSFTKANELMAIAFERGSHRFEWDHIRADGEVFPVEVLLTAVPKDDGFILHVVWRDITERKTMERRLTQTQKLEAIGKLAGGIAHDFNNLLVAIMGNAELLTMMAEDRPELVEAAREISSAAQRAADLTNQLLTFSRDQVLQPADIELNDVLRDLEKLLRRLIGEDIELVTALSCEAVTVRADRTQLEQVAMNLVTNARDAMSAGGRITVETARVQVSADSIGQPVDLQPGDYVRLSITDDGAGMSPEVVKRAFDPFFTTKEVGRGTGLGLSTVFGIVKQAEGEVTIDSSPGRGTTVSVYLPAIARPEHATATTQQAVAGRGGTETLLVVEDEVAVLTPVATVLRRNGYEVLVANNGHEALEVFSRNARDIALIVTDVVMPELGGVDMVARLRAQGHAPRVLFTSGYLDSARTALTELDENAVLLRKPYVPSELLQRVRQMLDRPVA
jgi:PAS domain S-box-containing protein